MIANQIKELIIAHAQKYPDQEVCGLICGDTIFICENISKNPAEEFEISPEYFERINSLCKVTAIYHSHCQDSQPAMLSAVDIANSKASKIPYALYHTIFGQWDYYDPNNIYPYPLVPNPFTPQDLDFYLGWRFDYNRSDCYTLVRSYYRGMLKIPLPDFPRGSIEETVSPEWNMFEESFAECGFNKLSSDEPLQANDIFLMCLSGERNRAHHAAILIDPSTGKSLHNLGEGRLSDLFLYGGYWATRTRMIVRYNLTI